MKEKTDEIAKLVNEAAESKVSRQTLLSYRAAFS